MGFEPATSSAVCPNVNYSMYFHVQQCSYISIPNTIGVFSVTPSTSHHRGSSSGSQPAGPYNSILNSNCILDYSFNKLFNHFSKYNNNNHQKKHEKDCFRRFCV